MRTTADPSNHAARAATPWSTARPVTNLSRFTGGLTRAFRSIFLGIYFLCFADVQVSAAADIRKPNPLIGMWILVKYVDTPENSEPVFSYGREPIGHFIFTADGHVAFSVMRNPPNIADPTPDLDPDACIPVWYCAYFGTYEVDVRTGVWVTHVQGSNSPGFLNTDQPRHFKISGDTLVISETYYNGSTRIQAERVFVREAALGSHGGRSSAGR